MTGDVPLRIAMWSGPRNISTALMRSFGNRPDTSVIDEPFYAAYLARTGLDHPMRAEVLDSQPQDWREVVRGLLGQIPHANRVFYQKHMTHHMLPEFGRDWMFACSNAFLIRDPRAVLRSYRARRGEVTLDDIGCRQQAEIFDAASQRLGNAPPVIDAEDVLADPEYALDALCTALRIPFSANMLRWPAGSRTTDGVWAPVWYEAVQRSTGFGPPGKRAAVVDLDDTLRPVGEAAWGFYERLARFRIGRRAA